MNAPTPHSCSGCGLQSLEGRITIIAWAMGGFYMFGFFRRAPARPFEFRDQVSVDRPAEEVYALIDFADPRNAMRTRGELVTAVEGTPERYLMGINALPEHVFGVTVTEAVPHSSYGFSTVVTPTLGRVEHSHEQYTFTPTGGNSCTVTLVHTVSFIRRMRLQDLPHEELKVSAGCHNALAKLKIQAEQGVDGVEAVANKLVV